MAAVDWHLVRTIAEERHHQLPDYFFVTERANDGAPVPGRIISREGPLFFVVTPTGTEGVRTAGKLDYQIDLGTVLPPVVGDYVELDVPGGRIARVLPRVSSMTRKEAGDRAVPQTLAANIDLALFVTTVPEERDYSIRRLERFLATLEGDVPGIVVLNKCDLAPEPESVVRATKAQLPGVEVVAVSAREGSGVAELARLLSPRSTVALAGSSGTGKSTLAGRLAGEVIAAGHVREGDTRGRHTTTSRKSYALSGERLVIDMPGVREVQLWSGDSGDEQLERAFPEIAAHASSCRFSDCSHHGEPGCAVQAAVQGGEIPQDRYLSYLELSDELERGGDRAAKQQRLTERRTARKARMSRRSRGGR